MEDDDLFSVFDTKKTNKNKRTREATAAADEKENGKWIKPEESTTTTTTTTATTNKNEIESNKTLNPNVKPLGALPNNSKIESMDTFKNTVGSVDLMSLDEEIQRNKKQKGGNTKQAVADISFNAKQSDTTLDKLRENVEKKEREELSMIEQQKQQNIIPENRTATGGYITAAGTSKSCIHEVLLPPGEVNDDPNLYNPPEPIKPARTYPFKLDPFQATSIACIERNESVLVSAHTSAGKTVVAEYSIATALRDGQRVIYTSPIKALSNQKFRDLQETFQDVGLMTGDITINANASCLVMTTEILRSMLYRGSETMREVSWVIFDEIHYLRDKERGVVWEETIILLPDSVKFVFLSATIPNAREFAAWIAKIHKQPCHVVYTEYRPIPLQHYIFPSGGDGLHLVVDENGVFREENFLKSLSNLQQPEMGGQSGASRKRGGGNKGPSDCYKIVKMIMERNYQPVIIFSFSKKECETYALQMSKLDFNNDDEKNAVETIFNNAIDSLSESDKQLPAVINILPLLKRGIGIHHAGLLPILKEIIEILFQYGYIKALFATETFSIGLNMPAKTVIFTSVRKFDGEGMRWISGGEYIQMSGRAGRRGLDERGIVILMVDEKMEPAIAKGMVKGQADRLTSSFWIGYSMLLNMLRVEDIDPENLLKRSFHQYQQESFIPQLVDKCDQMEQEKKEIIIRDETSVTEYSSIKAQLAKLREAMRDFINQPTYVQPFLTAGRIVRIREGSTDWGYGVILNFSKRPIKSSGSGVSDKSFEVIADILLECAISSDPTSNGGYIGTPKPCVPGEVGEGQIIPVSIKLFDGITSVCLYVKKEQPTQEFKTHLFKTLKETENRFKKDGGIPLIDPIEDMKIKDPNFKKLIKKIETLESRFSSTACFNDTDIEERCNLLEKKNEITKEIKQLQKQIKSGDEVILKDDLRSMKRILTRLGYITDDGVVALKGRVACEISAGDELVISELLFAGLFNDLSVEQCVAVFSCFVFQNEGSANNDVNNPKIKPDLVPLYRVIRDTASKVVTVSQECKLTSVDEKTYLASFNPNFMDVTFAWASGASFADIVKMTDTFEGNLIRGIRRLDELIRQMVIASKSIGNTELEAKFSEATVKIKRDIPFAGSLYL
ncbi:DEAD/DEAH box helicase [Dictyostelium discoideum AX4]|uniref:DEAD/DEAH box helicase n=1 Tax=Dictyostelium discoideum TaxID=44689 RepID=Q86IE2_DICDI|nr:DEAD/DEAH box helicase [Dictyostelium discoideum AX4]EAL69567.1 DEAD/DEAH box helicase [Dictyostelium discoideum AX4]|eukprot:XP_643574.1 DEAD/DEAH box helicase [Dictyostelium discoideum AX4]